MPPPPRRTAILATGFHVPARVATNDDLAAIMDTSDEWIVQRSGIKARHWCRTPRSRSRSTRRWPKGASRRA